MIVKVYKHKDFPYMFFFEESHIQEFIKFMESMKELEKKYERKLMYGNNIINNESNNS